MPHYDFYSYNGSCGQINPLKVKRTHVRGNDAHPYHLSRHRGYSRLGIRGTIRQRRRYFRDMLDFFKGLPGIFDEFCIKIAENRK